MAPTLYLVPASPPVRAVRMAAKSIGLDLNLKEVNLQEQEHKSPEYLKKNPQHTVPTLEDNGFAIWDSHAIMAYLVSKYAKDDSLYPKDLKKRAVIDQRLHFDSGVLWAKIVQVTRPIIMEGKKEIAPADIDLIKEVYAFIEAFLEENKWIAGDALSIADFSYITSLISVRLLVQIKEEEYPRMAAYLKRAESLPEYKADREGLVAFEAIWKRLLG